ncbi:MAG: transcriptional repressor NrdR [Proteobacteria bacterium]|nr:MAG: transcriptional repressor NrdR [Pseudomonadota bacterium]
MKCPFCNHADTQVIDTRLSDEMLTIKRRRRCLACDRRFNTFEKIELQLPAVVKSDGSREEYDETKIRSSMMKALHKRQVAMKEVDAAIAAIRQDVLMYNDREINSRVIGDLVMTQLARLDKVAYIRFASVYRSFNDVTDFTNIIKQVDTK